jgi:signal transduction histidine kinase
MIRALLIDRTGDLWIGTDDGLARFHAGAFAFDGVIEQLRNRRVWSIHEDSEGSIWLGTRGDGLFRIRDNKLSRFGAPNGQPSNYIYQVLADRSGALWLGTPSGVFTTHVPSLGESRLYDNFDAIPTGQLAGSIQPAGTISENGDLWLPSTDGRVHLAPGRLTRKQTPRVLIEEVIADGRQVPLGASLALGPGNGELEVRYTAVRLGSPEGIRSRYRLEGIDTDWADAVHERFAHYTNLSPRSYLFRVQAYDTSQPGATTEASLPIRWKPHFYQAWWFFTLLVGLVSAAAWQLYRTSMQQERLASAVLEERNRVAREMHDTLVQGCAGAFTMLEAAETIQEQSPQRARELVRCAREQVRVSIDEARQAIWNRRTQSAENFGARLTELAHSMNRDNPITIRLHTGGKPGEMAPSTQDNLLLVAREALLNALRHGSATRIDLDLRYARDWLELKIIDNG